MTTMDRSQLLRGALDAAVLAVISRKDGYGYDVVRRLRARGLVDVADASVYGTLRRLYKADLLTSYVVPSEEGPHRKYYRVSESGRIRLEESCRTWRTFAKTMDRLLTAS